MNIRFQSLLLFLAIVNSATGQAFSGRVIDTRARPISGALVRIAAKNRVCTTDSNGTFTISAAHTAEPSVIRAPIARRAALPEWFTLAGRRIGKAVPGRSSVIVNTDSRFCAPQLLVNSNRRKTAAISRTAASAPAPEPDTLLITHDRYLFRKVVVHIADGQTDPVVMRDTSRLFTWAWENLDLFLLDRKKLTFDPFGFAAPESLYASINDPLTAFYPPDTAKRMIGMLIARTIGLGVRTDSVAEGYLVKNVFDSSPAHTAGIRPGVIIVKVGDFPTVGMSKNNFAANITGNAGDSVTISVSDHLQIVSFKVVYEKFYVPSVFTDSLNPTTVLITITGFHDETINPGGTEEELYYALLKTAWADNVVYDMRSNGGGALMQAIGCISYLVPPGRQLLRSTLRVVDPDATTGHPVDTVFVSTAKTRFFTRKTAICMDSLTASSAEVFITMLRTAYPETRLIGTRTFGKATGQTILLGPDSSLVKITCVHFLPMSGVSYDKTGIQPDVAVTRGEDAVEIAERWLTGE